MDGKGLEEGNSNTDDAHHHTPADQQQEADAKAQANLSHNEATVVVGVKAFCGIMPAHSRQGGQNEWHHPDAHDGMYSLLFGVTQPGRR